MLAFFFACVFFYSIISGCWNEDYESRQREKWARKTFKNRPHQQNTVAEDLEN
jgi:hypothetical protein